MAMITKLITYSTIMAVATKLAFVTYNSIKLNGQLCLFTIVLVV